MPKNKNIRLMLALGFLQGMVFYSSVATLYRQAAGVSIFQITLIESISLLLTIVLEVPWGMLADRIGYRRTMVVCSGMYFLSKIVFWQADGFGMFLLERVLLAVTLAGLSGVDESIVYLSCREDEVQKVFGRWSALGSAGVLLSSVIFTCLIGEDYRMAALMTALSYGAAAALSFGLEEVHPPKRERSQPFADFRACLEQMFSVRGLPAFVLCGALFSETCHQITVFLNQLQYVRCLWDARLIGLAYIVCTLAELCSAFSDRGVRRLGERRFGMLLLGAGVLACGLLAVTDSGLLSMGCILLLCLASALFGPMAAAMENRLITVDDRATALSVNSLLSSGISIVVNLALGKAADANLPGAFLLGGVCCAAALALFMHVSGRKAA